MSSCLYFEDLQYRIGGYTIKEGQDVVIFANGVMVSKAMEAAELLQRNFSRSGECKYSKTLDADTLVEKAKRFKAAVAEEHIMGGL